MSTDEPYRILPEHGLSSWRYFAAHIWNSLPESIRLLAGTNKFKAEIRRHKFIHT